MSRARPRPVPTPIRRALLTVTVGTTLLAVLLVAVPLAFVRVATIADRADAGLHARATELALALHDHGRTGIDVNEDEIGRLLLPGTAAVVDIRGERIEAGTPPEGPTRTITGSPVRDVVVTLTADDSDTVSAQRTAVVVVAVLAAAASLVAAPTGLAFARRIEHPIEALAVAADAAGHGDLRRRAEPSGIAEIDRVGHSMNATLDRLVDELTAEQGLSNQVAHQLRNSLTALRLQVEVAGLGTDDPKVGDALQRIAAQVDRLDHTIRDLTISSRRTTARPAPLQQVVADAVEFWRPNFERRGRRIVVDATGLDGASPQVDTGAARQSLDVLVENALRHGAGTLTISQALRGDSAVVAVDDEGPGVPEGMERQVFEAGISGGGGTGQGLALARAVVEAAGGRVELTRARPALFEVWLPTARAGGAT